MRIKVERVYWVRKKNNKKNAITACIHHLIKRLHTFMTLTIKLYLLWYNTVISIQKVIKFTFARKNSNNMIIKTAPHKKIHMKLERVKIVTDILKKMLILSPKTKRKKNMNEYSKHNFFLTTCMQTMNICVCMVMHGRTYVHSHLACNEICIVTVVILLFIESKQNFFLIKKYFCIFNIPPYR